MGAFVDDFGLQAVGPVSVQEREASRKFARDFELKMLEADRAIPDLEDARGIALNLGFNAPDHVLSIVMAHAAERNGRRYGDEYKPFDHDMAYPTRRPFEQMLPAICAQHGLPKVEPVAVPA